MEVGEVVHATVAIIKRGDDVTRAPRNARLKVPQIGVTREQVGKDFFSMDILDHASDDVGPLGAVGSSLTEVSGARVKSAPCVQRKGLANLSGTKHLGPTSTHLLTLLGRRSVPGVCITPVGALSDLLSDGPTPRLFLKIPGGLSVEAKKFGFPDPVVWKSPVVGGVVARSNIVDAVSMHHVEPGGSFT